LWVQFTNSPGGRALPEQLVFGAFDSSGGYIFVRLQGSDDVLSIWLNRDETGMLRRTINFLNVPTGSQPSDLLGLPGPDFKDKVMVVYASTGKAAILDANAIQTHERTFSFNHPVHRARAFDSADGSRRFVALYPTQSSTSRLFVVDPLSSDIETVVFTDSFSWVNSAPSGSSLVLFHPEMAQSYSPGISVVRMSHQPGSGKYKHQMLTYTLQSSLSSYTFFENNDILLGSIQNSTNSFLLQLHSGKYSSLQLDKKPIAVGWIPNTSWIFFQQAHPLGSLTFVPIDSFSRKSAILVEGFMLEGLLDPS